MKKYLPILPVFAVYMVLFLVGWGKSELWQLMAMVAFYAALGQAFNVFMGMTGYVNFGYVAFLGLGTYGMALGLTRFQGLGFACLPLGLLLAAGMATLLALVVGAVALRLRGAYFAIATIGVNEGFRYFVEGANLWSGSEGILFFRTMTENLGRPLTTALMTFWADVIVFVCAVAAAVVTLLCMRSKLGYALTALREDEDAAKVMGINVTRCKIKVFIISALFAGLLGAVAWGLKLGYVYPADVFEIHYSVEAIIIVVLGGAGTLMGPVVGGLIYGFSKYLLGIYAPGYHLLIFAPLIIAIIVVLPEGIIGFAKRKVRGTFLEPYVL